MWKKILENRFAGYLVAIFGIAIATTVLKFLGEGINAITVALILLLVVLFTASVWGSGPAVLASLMAVVFLNYFFLPPVGALTIEDPENWVALFVFLVTAVTTGELSARAKRRAAEAEAGRNEIERLYGELQNTFEQSSQAKALKQSEKLKTALLEAVTHDLRTPLTSIKASVTTLLQDLKPASDNENKEGLLDVEGREEMLEVIDEETDRLDRFIEGLMELARIEAGDMKLRRQWGSVEEITRTAVKRAALLTRDHQVHTWIDDELPTVRVDERAIAEVVYNLLDNAAKYSPNGSEIRVEAKAGEEGTVKLIVEDQGPGIPAELRERVFEKFYRATQDGSSARKPAGTGMGLAIVRGIVEAHGGRVWIEPVNEHRGTRVVVILPTGDA
ncbi:MAG TPA: ATP-binding protein [Pyrinomonadaceae bacterium]|nr:ATP-binding protein [Pyrinomonadaceae bacterium]